MQILFQNAYSLLHDMF